MPARSTRKTTRTARSTAAAPPAPAAPSAEFHHQRGATGIEFAADILPSRQTVALTLRMLSGVADEPPDLNGITGIVERTLSKGTARFDGRGLADAFDALGAQWGAASGRQSTLVRFVCLPEFVEQTLALVAEMICRPTFPDDACRVAVQLAQENLKHLEDEPQDLVRILVNELALGPVYGRYSGGRPETLARITPDAVRDHWRGTFHAGRLQVAAAGPVDAERLARQVEHEFGSLGDPQPAGRQPADYAFTPQRAHRDKDLKQEYIAITLEGLPRQDPDFAAEQVLLGVLSGGMSGRLFTEVREKQGLVYWVGAWHEQPRGRGLIHLGASTTPERCDRTFHTLLRELARLSEDLTAEEVERAKRQMIAHALTEDDLTRARAGNLADDLFHFSRPIGLAAKLAAVERVRTQDVIRVAGRIDRNRLCVATLGPRALH